MVGILILIMIFVLTILVCRNNIKNRTNELKTNLQKFNNEIVDKFNTLTEDKKIEFLNSLTPHLASNLQSTLDNGFNYANNHWAIQQQMVEQQELFAKLIRLSK